MDLYDSRGNRISLGNRLGKGGEGSVYEVNGQSGRVAKVYTRVADSTKSEKLVTMVNLKTERLINVAAWPVDTLYDKPNGNVSGIVMPIVKGHREAHILYSPKSRLAEFPEATWRFLIQAAMNAAIAFDIVHKHGHIVGDVNHGNLLIASDATCKLIDCDSFQVHQNGRAFSCDVGVSTHTPPELQGRSFKGIVRDTNHDSFGLAVIIFQLLFMGRHPFSGRFLGTGDMSLEQAIKEYRFAYGGTAKASLMSPPPNSLPITVLPQKLLSLFDCAFTPVGASAGRPSPAEWAACLSELLKATRTCGSNPSHSYPSSLTTCPWCELERGLGIRLFSLRAASTRAPRPRLDLAKVWEEISKVSAPGALPPLPQTGQLAVAVSAVAQDRSNARLARRLVGGAVLIATMLIAFLPRWTPSATFWLLVIGGWLSWVIWNRRPADVLRNARMTLEDSKGHWEEAVRQWSHLGSDAPFYALLHDLVNARDAYQDIPNKRAPLLAELEQSRERRELERFLDSHRISDASITGIGPSRCADLLSAGIETALDVDYYRICGNVYGFGPQRTTSLVAWKDRVKRRFRFDPSRGVSAADVSNLDAEISAEEMRLEALLTSGARRLADVRSQIEAKRAHLWPILCDRLAALIRAEQELKAT